MDVRKIIHVDMDMFFAAIEIRDNPSLQHKPVVVGGKPVPRSVVATANYEARKYGIKSAMSSMEAYRRCPHCIFISPNREKYTVVSHQIREIFHNYTEIVEPLSCDEAFLDVTQNKHGIASATHIAQKIKDDIYKTTSLTASAGISSNKFVAKIASDYNKPNGLCTVPPEKIISFTHPLIVKKIPGVGKVTNEKMEALQIKTISDLAHKDIIFLTNHFGKFGIFLYNICRGIDNRKVTPQRTRKSYGQETTFSSDMTDLEKIYSYLEKCCHDLLQELNNQGLKAKTVTVKIKYHNFRTSTRSNTSPSFITSKSQMYSIVKKLASKTDVGKIPIRLAGVSLSRFDEEKLNQMYFSF